MPIYVLPVQTNKFFSVGADCYAFAAAGTPNIQLQLAFGHGETKIVIDQPAYKFKASIPFSKFDVASVKGPDLTFDLHIAAQAQPEIAYFPDATPTEIRKLMARVNVALADWAKLRAPGAAMARLKAVGKFLSDEHIDLPLTKGQQKEN